MSQRICLDSLTQCAKYGCVVVLLTDYSWSSNRRPILVDLQNIESCIPETRATYNSISEANVITWYTWLVTRVGVLPRLRHQSNIYTFGRSSHAKSLCMMTIQTLRLVSQGKNDFRLMAMALGVSKPRYNEHCLFRLYRTWQVKGRHGRISHMGVHPPPAKSLSTSLQDYPKKTSPHDDRSTLA